MTETFTINPGDKPTQEMLDEVKRASQAPIVFDEDCPPLSPAMMKAFKCAVAERNRRKNA